MNSAKEKIKGMVDINLTMKLLTTTDSLLPAKVNTHITNGAKTKEVFPVTLQSIKISILHTL